MEEIKVGEYVRIDKDFRIICIGIGKVVNKTTDTISVEMSNNNLPISFNIDNISKYSKNIIDLIEVGDYVDGERMDIVDKDENGHVYYLQNIELPAVNKNEITSIVTKEQFEAMSYRLED